MSKKQLVIFLVLALLLLVPIATAVDYPNLNGARVTDNTGNLTQAGEQKILNEIHQIERNTTAQIAVLLIGTLDGDTIENYAEKTFKKNGIGQKGKDNGVLLLIALKERTARIEVGYGLEGTLTDARSKLILENVLKPKLQAGDWDGGVYDAIIQIGAAIEGTETVTSTSEIDGDVTFWIIVIVVIIVLVVIIIIWWTDGGGGGGSYGGGGSDSGGSDSEGDSFGGGGSGGGGASSSFKEATGTVASDKPVEEGEKKKKKKKEELEESSSSYHSSGHSYHSSDLEPSENYGSTTSFSFGDFGGGMSGGGGASIGF